MIDIGGGNRASVSFSYHILQDIINSKTKNKISTFKKKRTAPKKLLVHWDDKTSQILDGNSKKKTPVCFYLRKKHMLLGHRKEL